MCRHAGPHLLLRNAKRLEVSLRISIWHLVNALPGQLLGSRPVGPGLLIGLAQQPHWDNTGCIHSPDGHLLRQLLLQILQCRMSSAAGSYGLSLACSDHTTAIPLNDNP